MQLLCFLFLKLLFILRGVHLFLTLLVTWELFSIFEHYMTEFYEVLSSSRYLAKQNRGLKFLKLMRISPTWQDVI